MQGLNPLCLAGPCAAHRAYACIQSSHCGPASPCAKLNTSRLTTVGWFCSREAGAAHWSKRCMMHLQAVQHCCRRPSAAPASSCCVRTSLVRSRLEQGSQTRSLCTHNAIPREGALHVGDETWGSGQRRIRGYCRSADGHLHRDTLTAYPAGFSFWPAFSAACMHARMQHRPARRPPSVLTIRPVVGWVFVLLGSMPVAQDLVPCHALAPGRSGGQT